VMPRPVHREGIYVQFHPEGNTRHLADIWPYQAPGRRSLLQWVGDLGFNLGEAAATRRIRAIQDTWLSLGAMNRPRGDERLLLRLVQQAHFCPWTASLKKYADNA
jgi:hypothetical protein